MGLKEFLENRSKSVYKSKFTTGVGIAMMLYSAYLIHESTEKLELISLESVIGAIGLVLLFSPDKPKIK